MHFPRILFLSLNGILLVVSLTIRDYNDNDLALGDQTAAVASNVYSSDGQLPEGTPDNPSLTNNQNPGSSPEDDNIAPNSQASADSTVSPDLVAIGGTQGQGVIPWGKLSKEAVTAVVGTLGLVYYSIHKIVNSHAGTENNIPEASDSNAPVSTLSSNTAICPSELFGLRNTPICDTGIADDVCVDTSDMAHPFFVLLATKPFYAGCSGLQAFWCCPSGAQGGQNYLVNCFPGGPWKVPHA